MKNWGSRSTLTRDFTNLLLSAASTDLLNINNGNTRTMSKTFSKLTTRTPEDITDIDLMCLLITLNRYHYYLRVLLLTLSKPMSVGLSQVVSTTIMKPVYLCNSSLIFWNLLNYRKISFQNWITKKHTQIWKLPITIIDKCLETF